MYCSNEARRRLRLLGCCAVGALMAAAGTAWAADRPVANDGGDIELETVVVTASRRDVSIRETPAAISAISGERMAAAHIDNLVDLVGSTPNVQIGAYSTNANIAIRGIGNNFTVAGSDPGVAFHRDGVYLANTGLTLTDLLDVSRVEVLRGPQGTLFGRNATGGAVNIIPNTPTADPSYGFDLSGGVGPINDHVSGFVSGPLSADGVWLGRFAAQQSYNDGFAKNLGGGGPSRLDDRNNYSARGQLAFAPSEVFNLRLTVDYQHADEAGPAVFNIGRPDPSVPLPPQIAGQPVGDLDNRETYANQGVNRLEAKGATLIGTWNLGGGSLKGVVSVDDSRQYTNTDGDGTPVNFTDTQYRQHITQTFAELVYASDASRPFTYVVGANYFDEKEFQDITVPISFLPAPGVNLQGHIRTHSYAAFVHGQYALDNGFKFFAGVRITTDRKHIDESNNFVGTASQGKSWTHGTYELGVTYDFDEHVTGYLKYATGYKGGGFSSGALSAPFNPETDEAIEAGLKGSYFDGRLQANMAAFNIKYDNLQVSQTIGVLSAVTNAARATVDGFEIEAAVRATDALHFELSGGWLNARFDKFDTTDSARPSLGVLHLAGNKLPQAPNYNASMAGYYDWNLAGGGKITFSAQYEWKSRLYFSEFNLPVASQSAVGKTNLTLNWTSADRRWGAGLYARNVTDETAINNVLVVSSLLGSVALAQTQPGREVGISLRYRY